jgi:hypothetical protein
MKKLILIIGLISVLFNSCKKYEDGPLISLRSPLNRLLGEWEVYYFEIDGLDNTLNYQNDCKCNFRFHSEKHDAIYFSFLNCKDNYTVGGRFNLNNESLTIESGNAYNANNLTDSLNFIGPIKTWNTVVYDVKRLKNKDLWVTCDEGNTNCYIKLKKTGNYEE